MWFKGISTMLGHPCVPPKLVSDPWNQFMSEDLGLSTVALQKPCKYRHTFKNFEDFILIKYYESRGKLPAMFLLGLRRRNQAWRKIGEPWYKLRLE